MGVYYPGLPQIQTAPPSDVITARGWPRWRLLDREIVDTHIAGAVFDGVGDLGRLSEMLVAECLQHPNGEIIIQCPSLPMSAETSTLGSPFPVRCFSISSPQQRWQK